MLESVESGTSEMAVPRNLRARAVAPSAITLLWQGPKHHVERYEIERRALGDTWHTVGWVPGWVTHFTSAGLVGGESYQHRVRAVIGDRKGPVAVVDEVRTPMPSGMQGKTVARHSQEFMRLMEASLETTRDGGLLAVYTAFRGRADYADSDIKALRSEDGSTWEDAGTVLTGDGWALSRPGLARLNDGRLGLTYSKTQGGGRLPHQNLTARKVWRTSSDDGRSWSDERTLSLGEFHYELGSWDRLFRLESGRLLTSVHCHNHPAIPFHTDAESMGTYLLASDDNGENWRRVPENPDLFFFVADNPLRRRNLGFHEEGLVEYAPDQLLMVGRTGAGWLYAYRSFDGGLHWEGPQRLGIAHPIAPPLLTRVPGTPTIALIYNPRVDYEPRWPGGDRVTLGLQLSDDGGVSWYGYREIEYLNERDWFHYPCAVWHEDKLHLIYSFVERADGLDWTALDLVHQAVSREDLLAARAEAHDF